MNEVDEQLLSRAASPKWKVFSSVDLTVYWFQAYWNAIFTLSYDIRARVRFQEIPATSRHWALKAARADVIFSCNHAPIP
jgi:hypothetical protein